MWFAAWIILIYIFQKPSCLLQSLALFICGFQQSVKSRWHYRFCVFLSGLWYANWCSERMWNELTTKSQENPFKVKRKGEGERKEWLKRDCKQGEQCAYTSTWVSFPFFFFSFFLFFFWGISSCSHENLKVLGNCKLFGNSVPTVTAKGQTYFFLCHNFSAKNFLCGFWVTVHPGFSPVRW